MNTNDRGRPIFRNEVADFLDIGTTETPNVRLLNVFTKMDENPNAQTAERHYVNDASASTFTKGYKPQFPFNTDLYADNEAVEFIRDIGEEHKLGIRCPMYRVRLYQPIPSKEDTYYARKFEVEFEITGVAGEGGDIMSIEGNMNNIGSVVIGEFNTTTQAFTPKSASAAKSMGG